MAYNPELSNWYPTGKFRFWCQKVLPLVYDDSLSYYELLCKVIDYLNKYGEDLGMLADEYKNLVDYVNNYMENEIEPKLIDIVDEWITAHPEYVTTVMDGSITENKFTTALKEKTIKDYYTPQMYGAVGDGTTDDTQAFKDCISACVADGVSMLIPEGEYNITDYVFGNVDIIENRGVYANKTPCFPVSGFFNIAESNLMHVKNLTIPTGFVVQATCYDSNNDYFYVGLANSDNSAQKILVLDNRLNLIRTIDCSEPALHLNTLTYNIRTNQLITIRSSGYDVLEINRNTGEINRIATLESFNSGIQYDPVLDCYIGINGPAISGTRAWNYRVYDTSFNVIKTGEFTNPNGFTTGETPNGFCCYDGKMVHSSFTTNGVQFGTANRIQFLFGVDLFGNIDGVYQEFLTAMEYEGVAYYNGKYLTANVPFDTVLMLTLIDPKTSFSTSDRMINQRFEMPITWDSTYVQKFPGHAVVNMQNRTVTFSGYVLLNFGAVPIDEEVVLGTYPTAFKPYGGNMVIPGSSGIGTVSLVFVNGEIRYSKRSETSQYVNLGGSYIF